MEITINEIKANLESLPESFYSEVNDFIDFLKDKHRRVNQMKFLSGKKKR